MTDDARVYDYMTPYAEGFRRAAFGDTPSRDWCAFSMGGWFAVHFNDGVAHGQRHKMLADATREAQALGAAPNGAIMALLRAYGAALPPIPKTLAEFRESP